MTHPERIDTRVPVSLGGNRLDQALAQMLPDYSRARIQAWIRGGRVQVDGGVWRPRDRVQGGERVVIEPEFPRDERWEAQAIPLDIVYADDHILVVNKPPGLVVHPAAGNPDRTLVNALLHYDETLAILPRAGIVHRLDKDTSGLMVVARTPAAHQSLVNQLKDHTVHREYLAVVTGVMTAGGTVEAPIGRHPARRVAMAVVQRGRPATSHYRVRTRYHAHTLVAVRLVTGRTHQVRVHMAHIGHPLVGDRVYGGRLKLPAGASPELLATLRSFPRQALHAGRLGLNHPDTGENMEWSAPPPPDLQGLIDALIADLRAGDAPR